MNGMTHFWAFILQSVCVCVSVKSPSHFSFYTASLCCSQAQGIYPHTIICWMFQIYIYLYLCILLDNSRQVFIFTQQLCNRFDCYLISSRTEAKENKILYEVYTQIIKSFLTPIKMTAHIPERRKLHACFWTTILIKKIECHQRPVSSSLSLFTRTPRVFLSCTPTAAIIFLDIQ